MTMNRTTHPTSEQRAATRKRGRTRDLVLRTALECIEEEGIVEATAAEIAHRCDLSWGVIQYHFGDRSGLFLALLDYAFDSLKEALARLESPSTRSTDRIEALVDGTWSLMKQPSYRVLLEVQLQLGRDPASRDRIRRRVRQMRGQLRETWRKALPAHDPLLVDRAERLTTVSLRGLALERAVEGNRSTHARERANLVDTLKTILDGVPD